MATNGKLEARITVPTGGWFLNCTDDGGGPTAVVIPAGTYYHSSDGSNTNTLAEAIATAANAVMTETWSCSISAGESGTGRYTIGCTGAVCTVQFVSNYLKLLLGFLLVTESGSTSYTAPNHAQGLWLASNGWQKKNGQAGGSARISDQQATRNAAGYAYGIQGQSYKMARIVWPMETRAKCWTVNESTTNESFETFLVDGIWGSAAWGTTLGPIRFYPDEDDDATYGTFSVFGMGSWDPNELIEHWAAGRWTIELPELVEVPA